MTCTAAVPLRSTGPDSSGFPRTGLGGSQPVPLRVLPRPPQVSAPPAQVSNPPLLPGPAGSMFRPPCRATKLPPGTDPGVRTRRQTGGTLVGCQGEACSHSCKSGIQIKYRQIFCKSSENHKQ